MLEPTRLAREAGHDSPKLLGQAASSALRPVKLFSYRSFTLAILCSCLVLPQAMATGSDGESEVVDDAPTEEGKKNWKKVIDKKDGIGKFEKLTYRYSILAESGFQSLRDHPPAQYTLRWQYPKICDDLEECPYHYSKIYVGPLPGTRYSAEQSSGQKQPKEVGMDSPLRIRTAAGEIEGRGARYFGYYAMHFEEENFYTDPPRKNSCNMPGNKPLKGVLTDAYTAYRKEALKVIAGFKLPVTDEHALATALQTAFKDAVEMVKPAKADSAVLLKVLMEASKAFNATTESLLQEFDLHRGGKNLPDEIAYDPWISAVGNSFAMQWCGKNSDEFCTTVGLGEYLLAVMWLKHHIPRRIETFVQKMKCDLNVTRIVSLVSQREIMATVQPYTEPYGTGFRDDQKTEALWLPPQTKESLTELYERVAKSTDEPKRPLPWALQDSFQDSRTNAYGTILSRMHFDGRVGQMYWPAFKVGEVPEREWAIEARHKVIPHIVRNIREEGRNIYIHCGNGKDRTVLFVALLLMEVSGAYWNDALRIVRQARVDNMEAMSQTLYLERYWRAFTARHWPVEGKMKDFDLNWDTHRPEEMAAHVPPWDKTGEHRNDKSYKAVVPLSQELQRELKEVLAKIVDINENDGTSSLIPEKDIEYEEHRLIVGKVIVTVLGILAGGFLVTMIAQFFCGESLMSKRPHESARSPNFGIDEEAASSSGTPKPEVVIELGSIQKTG